MGKLAIIGGTGVYSPEILADVQVVAVETPYGEPVTLRVGTYGSHEVVFLPRHGQKHILPPHKVNYRANMAALKKAGVGKIFATAAVGSLNEKMKPGHLAFLDQFIDFTRGREGTFYDGGEAGVAHIDLTHPYCSQLRDLLIKAAGERRIPHHPGAVYVCTEGPRFETGAEIKMFKAWGADLVGMTNVPEVVLARELGICYSTIALVTNFATGISPAPLTHEEVLDVVAKNIGHVRTVLMESMQLLSPDTHCSCQGARPFA